MSPSLDAASHAAAGAQVHYVALGDSSTEGLCDPGDHDGWIGWSQRLAHRFAEQHGPIMWANLAVRGMTCREILVTQLADAVALHPTHVTVLGGMNDLLRVIRPVEDTIADLQVIVRTLAATGATVATATLPDLSEVISIARPLRSRLDELNAAIRALAAEGVIVVDLAATDIATDERLWAQDRLHANTEGHRRIAEAMADHLGMPADEWRGDNFESDPITWTWQDHREWRRDHLYPWLARRLRREASFAGVQPRHREWTLITPDDTPMAVAARSSPRPMTPSDTLVPST